MGCAIGGPIARLPLAEPTGVPDEHLSLVWYAGSGTVPVGALVPGWCRPHRRQRGNATDSGCQTRDLKTPISSIDNDCSEGALYCDERLDYEENDDPHLTRPQPAISTARQSCSGSVTRRVIFPPLKSRSSDQGPDRSPMLATPAPTRRPTALFCTSAIFAFSLLPGQIAHCSPNPMIQSAAAHPSPNLRTISVGSLRRFQAQNRGTGDATRGPRKDLSPTRSSGAEGGI